MRFSARSCGPGTDVLEGALRPAAPADCESIGVEAWTAAVGMTVAREPVAFSPRGVSFSVTCPKSQSYQTHCALRLSVRTRRGTVIARSSSWLRLPQGSTKVARLRITTAGRRILRSRRVHVRVIDTSRYGWTATYDRKG